LRKVRGKDKDAGWYKVLTLGTEQDILETDKDQLYDDKSNGYIYIQKTEGLIQTTSTTDKAGHPKDVGQVLIFKKPCRKTASLPTSVEAWLFLWRKKVINCILSVH
jgi:hypothetical protein